MDANSFVLVSGYFDIWNLFFTGGTCGCSFCRVIERFAPTTSDVVGLESHSLDFVSSLDVF